MKEVSLLRNALPSLCKGCGEEGSWNPSDQGMSGWGNTKLQNRQTWWKSAVSNCGTSAQSLISSLASVCVCVCYSLNHAQLFATPWTVAHQSPLSMGFSRQEYWSGFPFPPPGDLANPRIEPKSPALQADSFLSEPPGKLSFCLLRPKWAGARTSPARLLRPSLWKSLEESKLLFILLLYYYF